MTEPVRRSEKREAIYALLCATKAHPSAGWVYDQLRPRYPQLSLGTVYRNLRQLQAQGKVRVAAVVAGQERYDADVRDHAHFLCTRCGAVLDLCSPRMDEAMRRCAGVCPYAVTGYQLTFQGVCGDCAGTRAEPTEPTLSSWR